MGWGEPQRPQTLRESCSVGDLRPSSTEVALNRMATALETLVRQQEPSGDIVEWLSTLSHEELDAAVMRRQHLGTPVMHTTLEVLKEWASGRA